MQTLLRISRLIDRLSELLGRLSGSLVIIMIAVGLYNVVARYIGRYLGRALASNAYIETQWYLFSVIFLLGFAYVLRNNQNVRVDFLYARWSLRRRAMINLAGDLLFLIPFCILGIVVATSPVLYSWGRLPDGSWGDWEISPDAGGLPRAPIKSMLIVGFVLLLLQSISEVIKHVAVIGGAQAEQAVTAEEYSAARVE